MATKQRRKNRLPPFVPLIKATMATPAWRAMSTGARLLYAELRGRLRNDYTNNGRVFLSDRDAAKAIGVTPGSVVRWYAENEHYGFLRKTSEGFLGADGRGIAAHYRFTDTRTGPIHRLGTSTNGTANCSSTPPAGPGAKNRNPCRLATHPVSLSDTYGRAPGAHPYVSLNDT
jgi:hypothetical protein